MHAQKLSDRQADWRRRAAEALASLAESSSAAASIVTAHSAALMRCCKDDDPHVRGAALNALEAIVTAGEGLAVTTYVIDIACCLEDSDGIVRRRAASLCRTVADAGFAVFVAPHVGKLVKCLEMKGAIRVTPLRTFAALAHGGEARAVVDAAMEAMLHSLADSLRAVRIAACDAWGSVARGGVPEVLRHWCAGQRVVNDGAVGVLSRISRSFFDDADVNAKLSSVAALRAMLEVDPDAVATFCGQHLERFRCHAHDTLGEEGQELRERVEALTRACHVTSQPRRGRGAICSNLLSRAFENDASSDSDGESEMECSICRRGLKTHGSVKALPCGHVFHVRCIDKWLQWQGVSRPCPLCRRRPSSARLATLSRQVVGVPSD